VRPGVSKREPDHGRTSRVWPGRSATRLLSFPRRENRPGSRTTRPPPSRRLTATGEVKWTAPGPVMRAWRRRRPLAAWGIHRRGGGGRAGGGRGGGPARGQPASEGAPPRRQPQAKPGEREALRAAAVRGRLGG